MTANLALRDQAVIEAVLLSRVADTEAAAINRMMLDASRDVTGRIRTSVSATSEAAAGATMSAERRRALESVRQSVLDVMSGLDLLESWRTTGGDLALASAARQATILRQSVPSGVGLTFRKPSAQALRSMVTSRPFEGRILRQWSSSLTAGTVDNVSRVVNLGLTNGEGINAIAARVRGQMDMARRHAVTITRTAVNHVSTHAREMTYEENEDLLRGVTVVATLDDRTSLTCMTLDGKFFRIGEGPRPPFHMQCRSTTSPVLKSFRQLGLRGLPPVDRASMDGAVPGAVRYPEWLAAQSTARQNEALGVTRARAFRAGAPLDELVEKGTFRPLTIAELRERAILN